MEYANNLRTIKLSRNDACKASSRRFIDRDQLTTDSEYIEIPKVSYTIASRLIFNTPIDVLNADWVHVGLNDYDTLALAYTDGYVASPVTTEDSKEIEELNNVEDTQEDEPLPIEPPEEDDIEVKETMMNAEIEHDEEELTAEEDDQEDEQLPIEPSEEKNKSEAVQNEEKPKAKQYQPKFKRKK